LSSGSCFATPVFIPHCLITQWDAALETMAKQSAQGMYPSIIRFGLLPDMIPDVHATQTATMKNTDWYLSMSCRRYEYEENEQPKARQAHSIIPGLGSMTQFEFAGYGVLLNPASASSPTYWSQKSVKYCWRRGYILP
jgi:hypothetical protein